MHTFFSAKPTGIAGVICLQDGTFLLGVTTTKVVGEDRQLGCQSKVAVASSGSIA